MTKPKTMPMRYGHPNFPILNAYWMVWTEGWYPDPVNTPELFQPSRELARQVCKEKNRHNLLNRIIPGTKWRVARVLVQVKTA